MVDSPEEQSHSLGRFLDLEAPESLERGQNLYDQPPFAEILTKVEDEVGIAKKDLAILLSMVSHRANSYNARPGQIGRMAASVLSRKLQAPLDYDSPAGYVYNELKALRGPKGLKAMKNLGIALQDYPYWSDYLDSYAIHGQGYQKDGSIILRPAMKYYLPAKSYAKWVTDKLRREGLLKLFGIEEVFPQDFSQQSPSVPTVGEGMGRENRRWRILKASEIVREKR